MANKDAYLPGHLAGFWLQSVYGLIGLGVLFGLRFFPLEYVGDLAAYLSAHEASKFHEMRSAIQAEAFKTACHVYASEYEKVNIVGHSLGSVLRSGHHPFPGPRCHSPERAPRERPSRLSALKDIRTAGKGCPVAA